MTGSSGVRAKRATGEQRKRARSPREGPPKPGHAGDCNSDSRAYLTDAQPHHFLLFGTQSMAEADEVSVGIQVNRLHGRHHLQRHLADPAGATA